jgi:hypothetical protein
VDERAQARPQVDPPVVLQPLERLAHGLPGYAQHQRQLALDEVLARLQAPADDHLQDRAVDALAKRNRAGDPPAAGFGGGL